MPTMKEILSPLIELSGHLKKLTNNNGSLWLLLTRVQSLGWEDPLEKEMVTYSSTLAWNIPWTEAPGRV